VIRSSRYVVDPGATSIGGAKPARSFNWRLTRVHRGLFLCFVFGLAQGCYVYTPVITTPAPPAYISLEISDRGRIGLGGLIGPAATRVEGVLQSETDSLYAVNVASVGYLNGQSNRWSGEPLAVRKEFIAHVSERRFSRSRTALATSSVIGGILLFALSRGLLGSGTTPGEPKPGEPPSQN